jgi:hypothetical protein
MRPDAGRGLGPAIATALRAGSLVAVIGIGAGFGLSLLDGSSAPGATPLIDAIRGGGSDALIGLGLLALTLTPPAALAVAAAVLYRAGEVRPAAVAVAALVLLLGSLALAALLGPTI